MKYYLNLMKYAAAACIFFSTALLVDGACQRPQQGPPGKQGEPGICTVPCVNGTNGSCTGLCVNGTDGTNGSCTGLCINGTDGRNGTDGTNGSCTGLCVNGTDGTNGSCTGLCVNGTDGRNGTDGINGTNGTNCNCSAVSLTSFGDWVRMQGEADVVLNSVAFPGPYERVPFNTPDVPAVGITATQNTGPGAKGTTFTLTNGGTYMAFVGIVTRGASGRLFKLTKSPFDLPLGKGYLGSVSVNTVTPVPIMFIASAGDQLYVEYVDGPGPATVGGSSAGPNTSFAIIQIAN